MTEIENHTAEGAEQLARRRFVRHLRRRAVTMERTGRQCPALAAGYDVESLSGVIQIVVELE